METSKTIILTYKNAVDLGRVIILVYYSGPEAYSAGKSLSEAQKEELVSFDERLSDLRKIIRESNPELYATRPYPVEALNKTLEIMLTQEEIQRLLIVFNETLRETAYDNFFDLEVITGSSLEDIREVYDILLKARTT